VPSKKEVTDLLARRLKLPSGDNITISIAGRFGSYRSKASAKVYSDGESMIRIEGGV
jgi:ribosomal protein S24E